ncbi:hypothetical protein [Caedibacter taeniospiralis]|jgi:hypothetical protein|uniref:hypothetical protein n=1 Tax=Caedibacter taeniospiralis TaxID=28907 RepID=UPI0037BF9312
MPIQKYLDPKNNIAFRRLFGTEKNKGIRSADEHYAYISNMDIAKAEGKAEGKVEIARNLKRLGMNAAQIVEVTGLTQEQLKLL